jgi:recombination protein RecT
MSTDEVRNHAITYSASYKKDLEKNWTSSKWSTDFDAMAKKTVLKLLLSKWGILSIDMQRAIQDDQKIYDSDGNDSYNDNPANEKPEAYDPFTAHESEATENDTNQ